MKFKILNTRWRLWKRYMIHLRVSLWAIATILKLISCLRIRHIGSRKVKLYYISNALLLYFSGFYLFIFFVTFFLVFVNWITSLTSRR